MIFEYSWFGCNTLISIKDQFKSRVIVFIYLFLTLIFLFKIKNSRIYYESTEKAVIS